MDENKDAVLTDEQQEALFKEIAGKRGLISGEAPATEEAKQEAAPEVEPEAAKEPATEEPVTEDSAVETEEKADKEAAKEPAKPTAEPVVETPDPILDKVPQDVRDALAKRLRDADALKTENDRLQQANRSMAGRVSAFQRRYEEAAGKKPGEAAKAAEAKDTAKWKQFEQDYPDIAEAIKERVPSTDGISPEIADVVAFVREEQANRHLTEAWETVEELHAGWREKVNTPEFAEWKKSSPAYEKLAASDDTSDAIALLDLYDAHVGRTATPKPTPAQTAAASKLAARRGEQVDGARSLKDKGAQVNEDVDMNNPEQLFAFYAAKADARKRAREL